MRYNNLKAPFKMEILVGARGGAPSRKQVKEI
jgi:hypothetical protein